MNEMNKLLLIFLLLVLFPPVLRAQDEPLEQDLKTASGEEKVQTLIQFSKTNLHKDLGESLAHAREALLLGREINYREGEMHALNCIGVCYAIVGYYDKALQSFQESIEVAEEIEFSDICGMYNNLGGIYLELDDFENAHNYFGKSVEVGKEGNKLVLAHTFANIGETFRKSGFPERALKYINGAKEIYELAKTKHHLAGTLYSLGTIHSEMGNTDQAKEYLQQSLEINQELGNHDGLIYPLRSIGELSLKQGDYSKALEYCNRAMKNAEAVQNRAQIVNIHRDLATVYQEAGEHDQAWEHLSLYEDRVKELNHQETKERVAQLQIIFETERKQKEIELLKSENEKQDLVKNHMIIGICGLLVLLYALSARFRSKQKAGRKLELQNAEITRKNNELSQLNERLTGALKEVRQLSGLLPICSYCKKIRDGEGAWIQLETYLDHRSDAKFSHSICPECMDREYSDKK